MKVTILLLFFVFYPSLFVSYTIFWVIAFFQGFGIIFFLNLVYLVTYSLDQVYLLNIVLGYQMVTLNFQMVFKFEWSSAKTPLNKMLPILFIAWLFEGHIESECLPDFE